jgi:hypothetical protein
MIAAAFRQHPLAIARLSRPAISAESQLRPSRRM